DDELHSAAVDRVRGGHPRPGGPEPDGVLVDGPREPAPLDHPGDDGVDRPVVGVLVDAGGGQDAGGGEVGDDRLEALGDLARGIGDAAVLEAQAGDVLRGDAQAAAGLDDLLAPDLGETLGGDGPGLLRVAAVADDHDA